MSDYWKLLSDEYASDIRYVFDSERFFRDTFTHMYEIEDTVALEAVILWLRVRGYTVIEPEEK